MAKSGRQQNCLVPYLDLDDSSSAVTKSLKSLPYRRNIFYLLGHSSGLFPPLMSIYSALFKKETRTLPLEDWQLVVLRISSVLDAQYEWEVNEPVARVHGMSPQKIYAIRQTAPRFPNRRRREGSNEPPQESPTGSRTYEPEVLGVFTLRDRIILELVDEQLLTYNNDPSTIEKAKTLLATDELVEIYIVLGVYTLIARITVGLDIDLDGDIPGLEESLQRVVTK